MSDKKPCTIYLVRHGETENNVKGVIQGHSDSPLTERGIQQAKDRGEDLKHIHFDAAFSSDILRANRTAKFILLEKKLIVTTTKALRERGFGKFEGKTFEEYGKELRKELDEFLALSDEERFKTKIHPEIDSAEEIVSKLIIFLRETAVAYMGKTVLVVSHGGLMREFLIHLGFGNSQEVGYDSVRNLGYIKLESDGVEFRILKTDGIEKHDPNE